MFEVFGALPSDVTSARPRDANGPLRAQANQPEFAELVDSAVGEGTVQDVLVMRTGAVQKDGSVLVRTEELPREIDLEDHQESFPILRARGEQRARDDVSEQGQTAAARVVETGSDQVFDGAPVSRLLPGEAAESVETERAPAITAAKRPSEQTPPALQTVGTDEGQAPPVEGRDAQHRASSESPEPVSGNMSQKQGDVFPLTAVAANPVPTVDFDQILPLPSRDSEGEPAPPTRSAQAAALPTDAATMMPYTAQPPSPAAQRPQRAQPIELPAALRARMADREPERITPGAQQSADAASVVSIGPAETSRAPLVGLKRVDGARTLDPLAKASPDGAALEIDGMATEPRGSDRVPGAASAASFATGRADLPAHVAQQLAQALRGSTKGSVDVALQPEELGRVKMTITASEVGVVVTITAERQETYDMMRRHAVLLSKELTDLGFSSVDLSFHQRGEHKSDARGKLNADGHDLVELSSAENGPPGQTGAPASGGLDQSKALDRRI